MNSLEDKFLNAVSTPSDINEHLPLLRWLAAQSDAVCELGVRYGCSTTAILAGRPKALVSYDLNPAPASLYDLAKEAETNFQFRQINTLAEDNPPDCDFLFIDTLHTAEQVYKELCIFAPRCSCWVAFHDTVTYWENGEGEGEGIGVGIERYYKEHPLDWTVYADRRYNNGLLVWERVANFPVLRK